MTSFAHLISTKGYCVSRVVLRELYICRAVTFTHYCRVCAITDPILKMGKCSLRFLFASNATIVNYYGLSGLKQHECIILRFWRSKSNVGLTGAKIKVSAGRTPFRRLYPRIHALDFSGFRKPPAFLDLCLLPSSKPVTEGPVFFIWHHFSTDSISASSFQF